MYTPGKACIRLDPTGRVLAVADPARPGISLFDIRMFTEVWQPVLLNCVPC